jgi:hypothetical protein
MVGWLFCFSPEEKQNIMEFRVWQRGWSLHGGQEAMRGERQKRARDKIYPSKAHPSNLLPPTRLQTRSAMNTSMD